GLDARHGHDGVGLQGILAPPDRLAPRVDADLHGRHVGLDRDAQLLLTDAVLGEQLSLSLGGGAAVAAHGGDDEGAGAAVAPEVEGGPDDGGDAGDAAAADADGDAIAPPDALADAGLLPASPHLASDVADHG